MKMRESVLLNTMQGFSLLEIALALAILTFGLLAAGQLIWTSVGSGVLARSKGTAAVTAQSKLEQLADLYRQDPGAMDLSPGSHGPLETKVLNPVNGAVLNRYDITWTMADVPDPRPGKVPDARLVTVTVTPVRSDGFANRKPALNKIISISTVLSPKTP